MRTHTEFHGARGERIRKSPGSRDVGCGRFLVGNLLHRQLLINSDVEAI